MIIREGQKLLPTNLNSTTTMNDDTNRLNHSKVLQSSVGSKASDTSAASTKLNRYQTTNSQNTKGTTKINLK